MKFYCCYQTTFGYSLIIMSHYNYVTQTGVKLKLKFSDIHYVHTVMSLHIFLSFDMDLKRGGKQEYSSMKQLF
jgi:hypothetical protein